MLRKFCYCLNLMKGIKNCIFVIIKLEILINFMLCSYCLVF